MKKSVGILLIVFAAGFQLGCASLNGDDLVCGPQRNGLTMFGTPETYHVACVLR